VATDGSKLYVNPALPSWLPEISIHNLRLGTGSLALHLVDHGVDVQSNTSGYRVVHGPAPGPLGSRGAVVAESPDAGQ
jgi:hypothetical protein